MITIIDGGMGSELIRRGAGSRTKLWSAQALLDAPETVVAVHRDYIDAGARIIITNSYATIPSYLAKLDMADRYVELTDLAGKLARQAADTAAVSVRVAGSLPPLSESYRADLVPPDEEALPIYANLAAALAPSIDLFICETMSCAREARSAARMALEATGEQKPVFVSWTLAETPGQGLRSGESIAQAFELLADLDIAAFLFNCTSPEAIAAGLLELRDITEKPIGAYPNRFHVPEGWTLDNDVTAEYHELSVTQYVEHAIRWIESGASMVGGCCGIGPEYIEAIAERITRRTSHPRP